VTLHNIFWGWGNENTPLNPKIFKKFLRRGHCPLPRSLPLCVYTMQMLQENIEGRLLGNLRGKLDIIIVLHF